MPGSAWRGHDAPMANPTDFGHPSTAGAARHRRVLGWLAAGTLLLATGCSVWRLEQARVLARGSEAYRQSGAPAGPRVLVVGDSTAVGTGASTAAASVVGLLGAHLPEATIDNRGRVGATFADVVDQLAAVPVAAPRYDAALLLAGGNDVIRLRDMAAVRADIGRAVALARQRAGRVIVMPAGNVGNAPFFWPPLSWWMSARARALHAAVAGACAEHGAVYVDLFRERADDPFVQHPGLNARDGLHPSDAGYALWWRTLDAQAGLVAGLAAGAVR